MGWQPRSNPPPIKPLPPKVETIEFDTGEELEVEWIVEKREGK